MAYRVVYVEKWILTKPYFKVEGADLGDGTNCWVLKPEKGEVSVKSCYNFTKFTASRWRSNKGGRGGFQRPLEE